MAERSKDDAKTSAIAPLMISPKAPPRPRPVAPPEPVRPRRFRVIDVMSRRVLIDDAGAASTVRLLEGVARLMDVNIYVWEQKAERWKQLSRDEQQALWNFRGRRASP